jgi:hypothetical protein
MTARTGTAPVEGRKVERVTPRGAQPEGFAAGDNVVRGKVFLGKDSDGRGTTNILDVAKAVHDTYRGAYQANTNGRFPVAHVDTMYPDARHLNQDASGNYHKMEATTNPTAIVAAGGLCAPLENLYDVEVIGSAERPIRDSALTRFQVERGGIQYRPNVSAASAVYGSGVWTMTDDAAGTGTKACYQVDCPGLQTETVEAIYECLEFSNITAMYDPETTASNVKQGDIAHARLAENRLLAKMASAVEAADRAAGHRRYPRHPREHRQDDRLLPQPAPHHRGAAPHLGCPGLGEVADAGRPGPADGGRGLGRSVGPRRRADQLVVLGAWCHPRLAHGRPGRSGRGPDRHHHRHPHGRHVHADVLRADHRRDRLQRHRGHGRGGARRAVQHPRRGHHRHRRARPGYRVHGDVRRRLGWRLRRRQRRRDDRHRIVHRRLHPCCCGHDRHRWRWRAHRVRCQIAGQVYPDAAAAAAIPGFPDQIDSLLYTPGSWLFLDGGELNLGLVRDSSLNARNRYRQFMETFEGCAFRGIESLRLVMSVEPTGQTSGTKDLSAIAD